MDDLQMLRGEIDAIDGELVKLFEKRMNTVRKVAEYKHKNHVPVLHTNREQQVLDRCCSFLENQDYREALIRWMQTTMELSRAEQERYIHKQ